MTFCTEFLFVSMIIAAGASVARGETMGSVLDEDGREIVIPSPKRIVYGDEFFILDGAALWAPEAEREPAIGEACILIERTLEALGAELPMRYKGEGKPPNLTVFLATLAGSGLDRVSEGIYLERDTPETYAIRVRENKGGKQILCIGLTPRAVYYAATTLVQLISRKKGKTCLRKVAVDDWPSYEVRFFPHDGWGNSGDLTTMEPGPEAYLEFMDWISRYKVNTFGAGKMLRWKSFFTENNLDREWVGKLSHYAREKDIIDFLLYLHVGGWGETPLDLSADEQLDVLIQAYQWAMDEGARHIGILADDYRGFTDADKTRFASYEKKHIYLVNKVYSAVRQKSGDALILYCAFGYQTAHEALRTETAEIARAIPEDVGIIWTGPETRSRQITREDMQEVTEILGRKPFLWDNTIYAAFDWRRPFKLLNAYVTRLPLDMPERLYKGIHINGAFGSREFEKVHLLTAADYLWNHRDYDPKRSLRNAVARVFGTYDAVEPVLAWRDNYLRFHYWGLADRLEDLQEGHARDREILAKIENVSNNIEAIEEISVMFKTVPGKTLKTYIPQQLSQHFTTNSHWTCWSHDEDTNCWKVDLTFPGNTPSRKGDEASVTWKTTTPEHKGTLSLVFIAEDDLHSRHWTEYRYFEVVCKGKVLRRNDLATNPRRPEWICVDLSEFSGEEILEIVIRVVDERPVKNYPTRLTLGRLHLVEQ